MRARRTCICSHAPQPASGSVLGHSLSDPSLAQQLVTTQLVVVHSIHLSLLLEALNLHQYSCLNIHVSLVTTQLVVVHCIRPSLSLSGSVGGAQCEHLGTSQSLYRTKIHVNISLMLTALNKTIHIY